MDWFCDSEATLSLSPDLFRTSLQQHKSKPQSIGSHHNVQERRSEVRNARSHGHKGQLERRLRVPCVEFDHCVTTAFDDNARGRCLADAGGAMHEDCFKFGHVLFWSTTLLCTCHREMK